MVKIVSKVSPKLSSNLIKYNKIIINKVIAKNLKNE